jgi:hypothetical protein
MEKVELPLPPRVYKIEIVVDDEDIDGDKLQWLLEEAGQIREIKMTGFEKPKYLY